MLRLACTLALCLVPCQLDAADLNLANRVADEGFNRSAVAQLAAHLTDQIGPRLTNSPGMRAAEAWSQSKFREWGLSNVRAEGFEFGRGWWIESSVVRMVAPRSATLMATPVTWTPATPGPMRAPIVVAPMKRVRDFAEWKGRLAGKIVLVDFPAPPQDATEVPFRRFDDTGLRDLGAYRQPVTDPIAIDLATERFAFPRRLDAFLKAEGALAWVRMSKRGGGLVHGDGYIYKRGETPALPGVEVAAEDYRRLARLAKLGSVSLEIDSRVHFEDADPNAYNIIADIPGSSPSAGYVMAGAHLDSWAAADGAADNAAGVAIVMEAARIISRLKVRPRRTIRFALWSGEEQGLRGSFAYVERYLARRPTHPDSSKAAFPLHWVGYSWPVTPLPGFSELTGYFNVDNGSGKIRGIYAEGNFAAVPILQEWLAPFASMGANTVVAQPVRGTDHVYLSSIGLPAFQFIQDPLDYDTTVHHTNLDTFDHLRPEDMRQAAVVLASVLLAAAQSEKPLPRNVLPERPSPTDPFAYEDPDKK